jgi:hypothetical protein
MLMFKNVVFAVVCSLTLLLGGCEEESTASIPAPVWLELPCDIEEVTTWTVTDSTNPSSIRESTTTRTDLIAVIPADPATVRVRVLRDQSDPCASAPNCVVSRDTRLSPEHKFVYFSAGTDTVTGTDSGETRVTCSVTHASTISIYAPGQPSVTSSLPETRQVFAEGGDYLTH